MTIKAGDIRVGDVILPPVRELSLWMRRYVLEHNLSETALHLTVTAIREGMPDKGGAWIVIECQQSDEWNAGINPLPFTFKARTWTTWPLVRRATVSA